MLKLGMRLQMVLLAMFGGVLSTYSWLPAAAGIAVLAPATEANAFGRDGGTGTLCWNDATQNWVISCDFCHADWGGGTCGVQRIVNPFGANLYTAWFGKIGAAHWIGWQPRSGNCVWTRVSHDGGGLWANLDIRMGPSHSAGNLFTVWTTDGIEGLQRCGFHWDPIVTDGHWVNVAGEAGKDSITGDTTTDIWMWGGDGEDWISSAHWNVKLDGGASVDRIESHGNGTNEKLLGGSSNDTVFDANRVVNLADCGSGGSDRTNLTRNASNVLNCELPL